MKKSDWIIAIVFLLLGFTFAFHQAVINKLHNKILIVENDNEATIESFNALCNAQSKQIGELNEEIKLLQSENHTQAVALQVQSEMLTNYDHHIDDLQKELNAYEIALEEAAPKFQLPTTWDGPILTKEIGGNMGPAGRETYYNLPMQGCINKMRSLGYSEEEYPYWIRDDGAKMLGRYVMIAANWKIRPLGTILETSLGWSIVVDTGDFVADYPYGVDIAVDW